MDDTRIRDSLRKKRGKRRARLELQGIRSAWLAHDLDLLLTEATLQTLLALVKTPHHSSAHSHILNATRRIECAATVAQQLLFSMNSDEIEVELLNLNDLVLEIEPSFVAWADNRVNLQKKLAPDLPNVYGNRFQLQQLLLNLLMNATEAVTGNGQTHLIRIVTQPRLVQADSQERFLGGARLLGGCYACAAVHDSGEGLNVEQLEYALPPEIGPGPDAHCTGFSLFTEIVRRHGGGVQVQSVPEEETIFRFCLPAPVDTNQSHRAASTKRTETVLIIDDDRATAQAAGTILELRGYETLLGHSGPEGVALFQRGHRRIKAVLLNVHMPGMDGLETLQHLQQIDPNVRCILCSEDEQDIAVARQPHYQRLPFLVQPYDMDELVQQVEMQLAEEQMIREPRLE